MALKTCWKALSNNFFSKQQKLLRLLITSWRYWVWIFLVQCLVQTFWRNRIVTEYPLKPWKSPELLFSANCFTSLWISRCFVRLPFCLYLLPHIEQLNGFSPVWILTWTFWFPLSIKPLPHTASVRLLPCVDFYVSVNIHSTKNNSSSWDTWMAFHICETSCESSTAP